jgi:DNA-directed RNA polymerase omega subunit
MVEYLEELEKLKMNRYQQVVIASKYARLLNKRLSELRQSEEVGEDEKKPEPKLYRKSVEAALRALLEGKIEYESAQGEWNDKK